MSNDCSALRVQVYEEQCGGRSTVFCAATGTWARPAPPRILWVRGVLKWLSRESLGNGFWFFVSIKFKPLTFIEPLLCALMVTGKGHYTVDLNRISNCFLKKKASTCWRLLREGDTGW